MRNTFLMTILSQSAAHFNSPYTVGAWEDLDDGDETDDGLNENRSSGRNVNTSIIMAYFFYIY